MSEEPTSGNGAKRDKPNIGRAACSVEEFCRRWGFGRNTFYSLVASGDLQTSKLGRRRIITLAQEEAFRLHIEHAA